MSSKELPPELGSLNFRRKYFELRPEKAALLVIDMQEFFLNEQSHACLPDGVDAIPGINGLIQAFRKMDSNIIFTRHVHKKGSDPGTIAKWWSDVMWEGHPFMEIDPRLDHQEKDKVFDKDRYDAFLGTELEQYLRSEGLSQIVITGVMTNLCCETTARSAFCRDFEVFFVHDCTGTSSEDLHLSSLRNLAYGFAVLVSCEDILAKLEGEQ